jgi:hypothetical protein
VKKRILDDAEGRKALWERLQFSAGRRARPLVRAFDKARSTCGSSALLASPAGEP